MLASQTMDSKLSPVKQNRYTCVGCRIKFDTGLLQRDHFKTEWHLYNLKRRVCNLEPIDNESFQVIQANAPNQVLTGKEKATPIKTPTLPLPHEASTSKTDVDSDDNDEDWEEVEDDDLLDEDWDDEEAAEMLARVVKSNTCLFCDKKSPNTNSNLEHMNLVHGFFIPEQQYLIDLEGLMEYLGFKVGAGATCLWCSKQFSSLHGVRLHMMYKDHCKIAYDQTKAVDEFKEFYDYSNQEQFKMKPITELMISKSSRRRHLDESKSLLNRKSSHVTGALVKSNRPELAAQAKSVKKFNAYRAKILLRTGMANNNTMRSRLRRQNPF